MGGQIPEKLEQECPLGVLSATVIKAFVCATTESSCYADYAGKFEQWLYQSPDSIRIFAHSRWPLAIVLNHMARATRHRFHLDFTEAELVGGLSPQSCSSGLLGFDPSAAGSSMTPLLPRGLLDFGPWAGTLEENGYSRSFRDLLAALPQLGPSLPGSPTLVYITMVYGASFNVHIKRFCSRARALGVGERLLLMTLDDEAFRLCLLENGGRCIRGKPCIMNKFTLPLMFAHMGLDSFWIDLDVFMMVDPTPALLEHAERGPYD